MKSYDDFNDCTSSIYIGSLARVNVNFKVDLEMQIVKIPKLFDVIQDFSNNNFVLNFPDHHKKKTRISLYIFQFLEKKNE